MKADLDARRGPSNPTTPVPWPACPSSPASSTSTAAAASPPPTTWPVLPRRPGYAARLLRRPAGQPRHAAPRVLARRRRHPRHRRRAPRVRHGGDPQPRRRRHRRRFTLNLAGGAADRLPPHDPDLQPHPRPRRRDHAERQQHPGRPVVVQRYFPTDFKYDLPPAPRSTRSTPSATSTACSSTSCCRTCRTSSSSLRSRRRRVGAGRRTATATPTASGAIAVHLWHQDIPGFVCPDDALLPGSPLPNLLGDELQEARLRLDDIPSFHAHLVRRRQHHHQLRHRRPTGPFAFLGGQVALSTVFTVPTGDPPVGRRRSTPPAPSRRTTCGSTTRAPTPPPTRTSRCTRTSPPARSASTASPTPPATPPAPTPSPTPPTARTS